MLLAAILVSVLGYSMVYAALHGTWAFWTYFFPKQQGVSPGVGTPAGEVST
jgi:hypothetical protein